MTKKRFLIIVVVLVSAGGVSLLHPRVRALTRWAWSRVPGGATVAERLAQYGPAARERLAAHFGNAGVDYPPRDVVLVGIKNSRKLEVWARAAADRPYVHVATSPVLAASGELGPKLRSGDKQVPEGVYAVESLNPNSRFHLSLRVNYPNEFDRRMAVQDGRTDLGGDIMIHGGDASIGCLAMGDQAAEDLFVLVADVGADHVTILLTPTDFRTARAPPDSADLPAWTGQLYRELAERLSRLR